jgi:hypothetical protein
MMQTEARTSMASDLADRIGNPAPFVAGMSADLSDDMPRRIGKLPERILVAAHQACDIGALDIAAQLLSSLEAVIPKRSRGPFDPAHRRMMESLIAVHHRLWHLRHASELSASTLRP